MQHRMRNPGDIKRMVFAGNCRVTLVSKVTGARFTFRVRKPKGKPYFVSVLTGRNYYEFFGFYRQDRVFNHSPMSKLRADAPSARAWAYFDRAVLERGKLSQNLEVWNHGHCGRCGKVLTVPASIRRGVGPECAGLVA